MKLNFRKVNYIIGVNRKKQSPNGEEVKYNIVKVPTIILENMARKLVE